MHIPPHDNANRPIVGIDDPRVPLVYFNIVKLKHGQAFEMRVPGYETAVVPATGTVDVEIEGVRFERLGSRGVDVWDGEPEGAYAPIGAHTQLVCTSPSAEVFIAQTAALRSPMPASFLRIHCGTTSSTSWTESCRPRRRPE